MDTDEMSGAFDGGDTVDVTMVCARFPPFVGGTETHVAEVSRRLVERGHTISVVTTALDPRQVGTSVENGVRITRVRAGPRTRDFHLAPQIYDIVRRSRSDVIHVQGYHTFVAPFAMAGAIAADLPFVVTFHSGGHSSRVRRVLRPVHHRILRSQFRRARRLIGVSAYETEMFRSILGLPDELFMTVTNGVAPEFLDVVGRRDAAAPTVLSVGRLEQYKRHELAISAIARVRQVVPNVRLRILGSGPGLARLRELAVHHYVDDIVEFTSLPFADRSAMARAMADASLVVLMSAYESQGIVGLEALATGTRLVVADGSALAELGSYEGTTVLTEVDSRRLADTIIEQLGRPTESLEHAVPTWTHTSLELERVYREIAAAERGG